MLGLPSWSRGPLISVRISGELLLARGQALLPRLVHKAGIDQLRLSNTFDDGVKLLSAALEGVISKCRDAPLRVW